eukprot:5893481-Prymnesium_polylepis.1
MRGGSALSDNASIVMRVAQNRAHRRPRGALKSSGFTACGPRRAEARDAARGRRRCLERGQSSAHRRALHRGVRPA